ncbi:MAG: hypothetical protein D6801_07030, partial [Alphaproteobacteria bacterium]
MTRAQHRRLGLALVLAFLAIAAMTLGRGGLYMARHEGDALHLMQIVLLEARGWRPHVDIETPIGILATAPMALFVRLGLGFGHAFLAAQALVAALLLPAIWHVAGSRLRGLSAWIFSGFTLLLCMALVNGQTETGLSVSMHYNRWAWALAYVALALAVLKPLAGGVAGRLDGAIVGLAMTALALVKITYFVAFAPAVVLALLAHRAFGALAWAVMAGLALAAVVTFWAGGLGFWLAYAGDLLTVAHTPLRKAPGLPFGEMLVAPAYLGASAVLV